MASKGNLYLKSASLLDMYNAVKSYETTVQDALYEQYKAAYKISLTTHMRGDAADAFKTYFSQGTINILQGVLDVSSEMTMIIQFINELFFQLESANNGVVKESTLDTVKTQLNSKKNTYDGIKSELTSITRKASQYISTVSLGLDSVDDGYTGVSNKIRQIRNDLYSADSEALTSAKELMTRITSLRNQLSNTMGLCYKDGNFLPENIGSLSSQSWYETQTNATLALLLEEDPFEYEADSVTVKEDQWASGLCSDVYAYAGYSWLTAYYEMGREDGSVYLKAGAAVLETSAYAQLTDYIRARAEAKGCYANVDAKAGVGDGYFGAHINSEVGEAAVTGSVVLGSEDFNGYVYFNAKLLCANEKAAFEFDSKTGEYAVGVDASAKFASVSTEMGLGFLSYKVNPGTATSEKKDLFKIAVTPEASIGAGFAAYSTSEVAIETDAFNINATNIKLGLEAFGGGSLTITVPTLYIKWPW
ncbi:MAG: LXG domain-containing protein [Clostridiales bacterium]|nr:LXG domain-containing protein [Clostridiales bacterium]